VRGGGVPDVHHRISTGPWWRRHAPQRIITSSRSVPALRTTGPRGNQETRWALAAGCRHSGS
jgi:hypothetical protein